MVHNSVEGCPVLDVCMHSSEGLSKYVRQGGYVFHFVCLFVSRIVQKLLNRFSQNSMERWNIGHRRNC